MQITRDQPPTGTANRTRREEIVPMFTDKAEAEFYADASQSEGWPWNSNPQVNTFTLQLAAMKVVCGPFALLDPKGDGVFTYWFNNQYLPMDGDGEEDDLSPDNFDAKIAAFQRRYPQFFSGGIPIAGGTEISGTLDHADRRFLKEFPDPNNRPPRARIAFTDGLLNDGPRFQRYLAQATASTADPKMGVHGTGDHQWSEKWAVAILGEKGGGGEEAYEQYQAIQKEHPWVHPVYFEGVHNPDEIGEDMAYMTVPTAA